MSNRKRMPSSKELSGVEFDSLPPSEKQRLWSELDAKSTEQLLAESRPLDARQRATWRRIRNQIGQPKIGKATVHVSVSLEKDLLNKADGFARNHGMSRSELIARGVKAILGIAA